MNEDGKEVDMSEVRRIWMNHYVKNLNRMEFVLTWACTGKCKHCSQGDHAASGKCLDEKAAVRAVREVAEVFGIKSLMTFGGEPLLHWKTVCSIHAAARESKIPSREIITNGYFTKDMDVMRTAVHELGQSGINGMLLSVDAFHQETIPIEIVRQFAEMVLAEEIPVKTNPAWLVSADADHPYNRETRDIVRQFENMGIQQASGNVIFPSGNAKIYLKEYFEAGMEPENPYIEDPTDVRAICIGPDGDVLGGNIYEKRILDILSGYEPPKE